MNPRRLGLPLLALALLDCKHPPPPVPDASVAHEPAPAHAPSNAAPENLLIELRGASLRRALPILFPQGGPAEVVEQLSRQITPGIADHGDEIDIDSPFAVAGLVGSHDESNMSLFVAWPLKPGMQISQQARNHEGYRQVSEGLYAPSSPDAGANADDQCWVAQRPPVGWMLLCGRRDDLENVAGYLRTRASSAPENSAVLDLDVHVPLARRLASRQLAEIDRQAPPPADAGMEAVRRSIFEQARKTAALMTDLANDADTLHATLTQDENAMHLRAEANFHGASSDQTRALLGASAGRQAPAALLQMLPAAVSAYVISGTDRTQASRLASNEPDPMLVAQAGPELARVMTLVAEAKDLSVFGERVDAYSDEDGYTQYHVVRRPDAAQFVNDLRVAINSIPPRAAAAQGALRIGILPTPGLTGTNYLRLGQVLALPPGVQVPPAQLAQVRAVTERSMLLVAEGDHVIAINGRDPIARYHAMAQGPHLNATVPANAVLAGRITGPSFLPLFFGAKLPGLPEAHASEPLEFALTVERRGEGAHVVGQADSPIGTATELRQEWEMVQLYQAQMMQQMAAQQRAAQQGGAGMPGGGMARPRPQMAPPSLPEPPQLQLQAPQ